jgi:hypothetical protein
MEEATDLIIKGPFLLPGIGFWLSSPRPYKELWFLFLKSLFFFALMNEEWQS